MSVVSFFEKVVGLQEQRAKQKVAGYRELVAGVATGQNPDPTEVADILADANKSVADLKADVERYQHRMALKALVASMPKLEAERRDIDEQIARADRALQAAEKQHEDVTEPLYARRQTISQALSDASSAQAELFRTCDDADLRCEMAEVEGECRRLDEQRRELFDRATYMDEKARHEAESAERELTLEATDARREVAERYRKDAEAARREVKRLDRAQADATKRREQVEHRMQLA
jgi:chromosome segregation ATPase